jgi:hypothetical protein
VTFSPEAILDWVDEDKDGQWQTALSRKCGIDAVRPGMVSFDLSPDFLAKMKAYWF